MKKVLLVLLGLFGVFILGIVFVLGYFGYIPGLSKLLGADKPRDLGVTYSEKDFQSARTKSKLEYGTLPSNTSAALSIQRSGSRPVNTSWDSAEITALMNNRPYKYWPIKNVQLKINNDGTAELSGIVIKDKLTGYAAGIGVPTEVVETVIKFLPPDPSFYVKAKTALKDNKVSEFDVQSVYLGKMPIPVNTLLANLTPTFIKAVYAEDAVTELSKYEGKKAAIIEFINERLAKITGFHAKDAHFEKGKLFFDGTLSQKEMTVR